MSPARRAVAWPFRVENWPSTVSRPNRCTLRYTLLPHRWSALMSPNPHDTSPHDTKIIEQFTRWAQPFADLPIHSEAEGLARTLAAAAIEPHMSVLDVACGPGIVACAAARTASHVTGIDLTPAMIDQAQKRQRAMDLGNLDWRVGNACALPFNDGAF